MASIRQRRTASSPILTEDSAFRPLETPKRISPRDSNQWGIHTPQAILATPSPRRRPTNNNFGFTTPLGKHRSSKKADPARTKLLLGVLVVLSLLPWARYWAVRRRLSALQREVESLQEMQNNVLVDLATTSDEISSLKGQADKLEHINGRLYSTLREQGSTFRKGDEKRYETAEKLEEALVNRIDSMKVKVRETSRHGIVEKYGVGPYRVRVNLKTKKIHPDYFIIEMAPLTLMPHATYHFLEMVEAGLWDGLTLVHRQESRVIQATPLISSTARWAMDRFDASGITKMAFSEYSYEYPHKKYRVAFAGNPGGPNFYIHLDDQEWDGPRSPANKGDHESCFGEIVEGQEAIELFAQGGGNAMTGIRSIEIVMPNREDGMKPEVSTHEPLRGRKA